ncbi:MAG TPA: MFS transporter [Polyangiales bacterium]|nr:MFS transporter [Polyangiales bacterium]
MDDAQQAHAASIWRAPLGRLTIGLTLTVAATAFEALAVATILPITLDELGDLVFYGWTFSAFLLANLVGISIGGSESERLGLVRLFAAGVLLFSGGLVVSGCAPAMSVIVGGRVLQGFGAGLLSTVAYAAIAQAYAASLQPRMLATLSSAWVVPGLVGPGLASLIAEHASWRWVFWGLVPLPLLAATLVLPALRSLPRTAAKEKSSGSIALAVQLGLGASAALSGLGMHSWPAALALVVLGGAAAVHALTRLLPRGTLLARAGLPAAVASMALINFAFFGAEAFLPLALSRVRQAPVVLSGLALTAAALTWTAGAWLPVRVADRISRRKIILGGLAILAVGLLATLSLLTPEVPAACAVVAWGITGLGMGLAFTTTSAAILETAGPSEAGLASASLQLAQVLGAAIATGAGGAVVAAPFAGDPPALGIAIVDIAMLLAIGLAMLSARGIPNQGPYLATENTAVL